MDTRLGWVKLNGRPIINRYPGSTIRLGPNTILTSRNRENVAGVYGPVILSTVTAAACIELAGNNGISSAVICAATRITLGQNTMVGVNCRIYDTDFHPVDPVERLNMREGDGTVRTAPVTIGSDAWLGASCIILKGTSVGDAAVIAAGAVVSRDVPARAVVGGNPARVLRTLPSPAVP